jgi:superfamily II DNA or RNA helicase
MILRENYVRGQSWLIYCEDQAQLNEIVAQTRTWCGEVLEYHTSMQGDARATLSWFQEHGGILVAIACLDEGVNIPSISHAIILASSQNPRQFIQRRGRILRRFPGKRIAYVYDVLVSPEDVDAEPTQKSLLKSELRRALEFASSATNQSATSALRLIAVRAGLDPDTFDDAGSEEDISLEDSHVE